VSLHYLLDENISHEIATQVNQKRPDIPIQSLHFWREGVFLHTEDREILLAAAEDGLPLVTYDLATIPTEMVALSEQGIALGGVIFVDELAIASNDFGGLVRALIYFWEAHHDWEWTNRVDFLKNVRA
jgi:hypothetical protein